MSNLDGIQERVWQNAWGVQVASLQSVAAPCAGIRVWFEGPRHGWLFLHLDLIGAGEFVCRVSHLPNDFLGELTQALGDILKRAQETQAAAHGEPDTFELRFTRPPRGKDIRLDLVRCPSFDKRAQADTEKVLTIESQGDSVCRAFVAALRELRGQVTDNEYLAEMRLAFPAAGLTALDKVLGNDAKPGPPPKVAIAPPPAPKPPAQPARAAVKKAQTATKPARAAAKSAKKSKSPAKPAKKPKRKGK